MTAVTAAYFVVFTNLEHGGGHRFYQRRHARTSPITIYGCSTRGQLGHLPLASRRKTVVFQAKMTVLRLLAKLSTGLEAGWWRRLGAAATIDA